MTSNAVTTVYINPASSDQFKQVAGYTLADGSPAIDFVCIFGGNYAASSRPYLRANNDDPPTTKPLNPNIQKVLDDGAVGYLQGKGLKVLLTVLNGHKAVGWSEFTSESDAENFASYLKTDIVDKYGLDGIDIDDEYSTGTPNDTSLIMVTTKMKAIMPGKFRWGYAGQPVAVANVVGDEREELVNLYPVCFWIADGATGKLSGSASSPSWSRSRACRPLRRS